MSKRLAAVTAQSVELTAADFAEHIKSVHSDVGRASGLSPFLKVLEIAADALNTAFSEEYRQAQARNSSSDELVAIASSYLVLFRKLHRHLDHVAGTRHFEYPSELVIPSKTLIKKHIDSFALVLRGQAHHMYELNAFGNFLQRFLDPIKAFLPGDFNFKPPEIPEWFIFLPFPMVEMPNILLHTVILGHEIGHIEDITKGYSQDLSASLILPNSSVEQLARELVPNQPLVLSVPRVKHECLKIASNWLGEIVADLLAVRRFGLAYLFCILELWAKFGAQWEQWSETHPAWWLRIRFVVDELSNMGYFRLQKGLPIELAKEARSLVSGASRTPSDSLQKVVFTAVWRLRFKIATKVREVTINQTYERGAYKDELDMIVQLLNSGSPPAEIIDFDKTERKPASLAGILNAGWSCRLADSKTLAEMMGLKTNERKTKPLQKLNTLVSKAIESREILRLWLEKNGRELPRAISTQSQSRSEAGVVSGDELMRRLYQSKPPDRLVITPLLEREIQDGTVDLRLGTKFIVTQKSEVPSVDPLKITSDEVRRIQSKSEVQFGKEYILHPKQLILAGTFEYVSIPKDLCAFVVTRSSYGRLGLLTVTAIFVHPGFKGCLTLEMVNYGDQPISLHPGLRIAQLVFCHAGVTSIERDLPKYSLATGPEFPKVHLDYDRDFLNELAEYYKDF